MRFNRNASIFGALFVVAVAAGCCGGSGGSFVGPTAQPTASPTPGGTATPPVWSAAVPFTVKTQVNLSSNIALPNGGGFAGTLATQATVLPYTQTTAILTNAVPIPAVSPLVVARRPQDVLPNQTLAYLGLNFTFAVPAAPMTIALQIPQNAAVDGASYFLALYDPQRPSLGWQHAFAGPAKPSSATGVPVLTFIVNAPLFNRWEQYWLAVYMLPSSAASPTPAPSISPVVTPTPTPVIFSNIQQQLSYENSCSGTPCATGKITPTQGPQEHSVTTALPSPVVGPTSGPSTLLQMRPMPNLAGDVLYYTQSFGEFPLATNFVWDFYVYVDQTLWDTSTQKPTIMQALEFDMNVASPGEPGLNYNFSSQCLMHDQAHGGPQWQVWGAKGSETGWIDSGFACDPAVSFSPMKWHHIVWQYRVHPDTQQTEYVGLTIDGGTPLVPNPAINPVQILQKQAKPTLEVQFQQDAIAIASPVYINEWVDDVTLTVW